MLRFKWAVLFLIGCNFIYSQTLNRFEFSSPKMGTVFRIILYAPDSIFAKDIAENAFAIIDTMNQIFSNYDEKSEISQLTKTAINGKHSSVSEPLWEVLVTSKKLWKQSKRTFDVTIGPLSQLWRSAFKRRTFPDLAKLSQANSLVGFKLLKLHKRSQAVSLQKNKMKLDFGGIAKGYTADQIAKFLEASNVNHYLIDAGGDLTLGAAPPDQPGWEILLPNGGKKMLAKVSVATSGDRYQYLDWNGKRYSHIIDPRTGIGISDQKTVTVIADTGMKADANASAISILSTDKGERLAKKQGVKVIFYNQNKN